MILPTLQAPEATSKCPRPQVTFPVVRVLVATTGMSSDIRRFLRFEHLLIFWGEDLVGYILCLRHCYLLREI